MTFKLVELISQFLFHLFYSSILDSSLHLSLSVFSLHIYTTPQVLFLSFLHSFFLFPLFQYLYNSLITLTISSSLSLSLYIYIYIFFFFHYNIVTLINVLSLSLSLSLSLTLSLSLYIYIYIYIFIIT